MIKERFELTNKLIVITGGSGLLGQRHAEAVIQAGATAVLLDLNSPKKDLGAKAHFFKCDITKLDEIKATNEKIKKQFGKSVDVLINNAAIDPKFDNTQPDRPLSRIENFLREQWDLEISVGLTGAYHCVQVFGTEMAQKKSGVIINVASDLGVVAPDQRIYRKEGLTETQQPVKPVTYSVIKHGLIGLTKYLATYWADQGVRCNAFAPGGVFNNHPEEFVKKLTNLIPMGRMANVDEYKGSIVFLASDASSYINGQTIIVDGGRSAW